MTGGKLSTRIGALEKGPPGPGISPVLLICFVGMGEESREMNRAEIGRQSYMRESEESEAAFMERMRQEVLKTRQAGQFCLGFLHSN